MVNQEQRNVSKSKSISNTMEEKMINEKRGREERFDHGKPEEQMGFTSKMVFSGKNNRLNTVTKRNLC